MKQSGKQDIFFWTIGTFVKDILHVDQELHMSSPPVFSGIRFARSLVFCVLFSRPLFVLLSFCWQLCHLSFTDSAYPFRIFTLFLLNIFVFILLILTSNETKVLTHNDAYVTVHMSKGSKVDYASSQYCSCRHYLLLVNHCIIESI